MFQIHNYYCRFCKAGTPHEVSEDGQRSRCLLCIEKGTKPRSLEPPDTALEKHLRALDGPSERRKP